MKREAERLQLAKSGYADSQLADPEVPQEPDIEALCAKAARTYDLTRREEDVCCASSLKGARHRKSPRSSSSRPTP